MVRLPCGPHVLRCPQAQRVRTPPTSSSRASRCSAGTARPIAQQVLPHSSSSSFSSQGSRRASSLLVVLLPAQETASFLAGNRVRSVRDFAVCGPICDNLNCCQFARRLIWRSGEGWPGRFFLKGRLGRCTESNRVCRHTSCEVTYSLSYLASLDLYIQYAEHQCLHG